MWLRNTGSPQNACPVFALGFDGETFTGDLVYRGELRVSLGRIALIFRFNGETGTQTGGFREDFMQSALKLLGMLQPMKQEVVQPLLSSIANRLNAKDK